MKETYATEGLRAFWRGELASHYSLFFLVAISLKLYWRLMFRTVMRMLHYKTFVNFGRVTTLETCIFVRFRGEADNPTQ